MASPTSRTLAHLRDSGWHADVVERWIQATMQRRDLFGFADLLAFRGPDVLLVQATSTPNLASRVTKILENETAREWIKAGHMLHAYGWRKYASPVDRKWWRPTIREISPADFRDAGVAS